MPIRPSPGHSASHLSRSELHSDYREAAIHESRIRLWRKPPTCGKAPVELFVNCLQPLAAQELPDVRLNRISTGVKTAERWKTLVNIPDFAALSGRENRRLGVCSILAPVLIWAGVRSVSRGTFAVLGRASH